MTIAVMMACRPALYKPAYARKPAAVVQEEKKRKREEREEEQRRRRELKQQREVERQARIEEGKKLEVLCRQVEGPHVWTGARTEDFVGRFVGGGQDILTICTMFVGGGVITHSYH